MSIFTFLSSLSRRWKRRSSRYLRIPHHHPNMSVRLAPSVVMPHSEERLRLLHKLDSALEYVRESRARTTTSERTRHPLTVLEVDPDVRYVTVFTDNNLVKLEFN